ncbi:MAG: DEAD/DEAH box helicase family protein, partial [Patulibacter sp.]|nr:DEAD/DEAH box helicase family protein [Patulibacter sp.]
MAQRPSVVTAEVTSVPDPTEIARVADFVREPFVTDGEDAAAVLAPGSIRRHAFEAARAELDAGKPAPSQKWRRRWSLLLGLDRTLNTATPVLADGTTLNPHQIDALSGTYAALLADAQARARGASNSDGDALLLSFEDEEPTELEEPPARVSADEDDEDDDSADDDEGEGDRAADEDDDDELETFDPELEELPDAEPESEFALYDDVADEDIDEDIDRIALEDPNAHKRFWFEHATGAGKTVAAMGFVEACRTGGILILTHRRNLVDQFIGELRTRGYGERLCKPLLTDEDGGDPNPDVLGPVTIETYQWFVRNAGRISGAYTVVICDEAHTALGDKTSAAIRAWTGPIFIGMTATGALIARHVADLFPTQTSRFDLAQAARRGVIAPLRCLRIPPGPGVRTIAKVPLRKGEVDMEFDQDELAKLLDQAPFNLAIADLYKTRFRNTPGVVYTAGVQHAYNVAESFRAIGMKAMAVSGETPKRELATILAQYDAGEIDVLINAQLLAEGWNSPRATICMHLAPTASKRIYQQRVGRVTRRHPGKEAGVVIDFVHPATPNDDPVVTLHSLLDRDVYRGGAIVVGPVRRGRGRRVKVERRVLPVTPDIERRRQVFERELWRIAVEQLDWGEQRVWAALAGAKASPANWRRGRAMLNFDRSGELRRQFLITALERNRSQPLRMRAIQEIALLREAEPFDTAIDFIGQWPRDERREASRTMLQAMADRRIGRRDQATAWIWRLAEYTRDVHEEYAAQRWPATKHLLGLLVNSSGAAHARNARRLVHGARQHDRRLQAALLAAAVAHSPEAEEVLREARTRLARKPGALSRDLLKDFPNGKRRKKRSRKKRGGQGAANGEGTPVAVNGGNGDEANAGEGANTQASNGNGQNGNGGGGGRSRRGRSRGGRRRNRGGGSNAEATNEATAEAAGSNGAGGTDARPDVAAPDSPPTDETTTPARRRRVRGQKAAEAAAAEAPTASAPDSE